MKKDLIIAKHYDKQFKMDAVQHYQDHKDVGLAGCASNLGISQQSLFHWKNELKDSGDIECHDSGNYFSDEEREIAKLKRELRDARDAIDNAVAEATFKIIKIEFVKTQHVRIIKSLQASIRSRI